MGIVRCLCNGFPGGTEVKNPRANAGDSRGASLSPGLEKMLELLLMFGSKVMSNSFWPRELQHARLPCPSLSPVICSNPCPLSQWCHPTISSWVLLLFLPSIFPSIRILSSESTLHIRWPKYWSFSFNINSSN